MKKFENVSLSLEIQCLDFGREFWEDYFSLDRNFRDEVCGGDAGDLEIARRAIEIGQRAHILGCADGKAVSFRRVDFGSEAKLGALFVDESYRNKRVSLVGNSWLNGGINYQVWQVLTKAGYVLARRAGYDEVGSFIHNNMGWRARMWRLRQEEKWNREADELYEPKIILDGISDLKFQKF